MGSSPVKQKKKVDPDAPGTPGKPGYEPPVKREDLDAKGKAIWDAHRAKGKGKGKLKKTKTLDDYLNEGFSQVEAEQMAKEGGVTGHDLQDEINKGRPNKKTVKKSNIEIKKEKSPAKQTLKRKSHGDIYKTDRAKQESKTKQKNLQPQDTKENRKIMKRLVKERNEPRKITYPEVPKGQKEFREVKYVKVKSPAKAKEDKKKFDTEEVQSLDLTN
jgi:hypothetical protein